MAFEIVDEMNEMARYLVPYRKAFEITGAFHELAVADAFGSLIQKMQLAVADAFGSFIPGKPIGLFRA